jgi:predicted metalloprotease with PDZ domain
MVCADRHTSGPRHRAVQHLLGIGLLFSTVCTALHAEQLQYSLAIDQATFQYFIVKIHVQDTRRHRLVFSMPNWIPGAYEWNEFGDSVVRFASQDSSGRPIHFEKLSRDDWEVQPRGSDVTVEYWLKPMGRYFLGSNLDSAGALIEGASTWMYVRQLEQTPVTVSLQMPPHWRTATGLRTCAPGLYGAADYDELADCPILAGVLSDTMITVAGIEHDIVFRGQAELEVPAFCEMVKKIVGQYNLLMGALPYQRYVFQYLLSSDAHGSSGLEHRNSTTIRLAALEVMQDVVNAAGITSHEFFHLWNVKRITDAAFQPLHYDREAHTESLWWFEGVTSYYADLALVRSGLWSVEKFFMNQANEIERLQENPDRLKTSVGQASWRVWQNGLGGPGISYYNKGQLLGLLLDIMIRKATKNEKSLDHVLRYLYHNYAAKGVAVREEEWGAVFQQATGRDFASFFDRYIYGLVELPYQEVLAFAGLNVVIAPQPLPSIGRLRIYGPRNRVFSLDETSPAAVAGLRRNDLILKADEQSFTGEQGLYELVRNKKIGQTMTLLVSRNGLELPLAVLVEKMERIACTISLVPDPDQEQLAIRTSWLTGK